MICENKKHNDGYRMKENTEVYRISRGKRSYSASRLESGEKIMM